MIPTSIIGFDSAWTDHPKKPGAICAIRTDLSGERSFVEPQLTSFDGALAFIERERSLCARCLVALDQPTIVPNSTGMRPVDRVAASFVSWLGGGVQPANHSKKGMFDADAPIWRFKERLGVTEDTELARSSASGIFLIEVFPALALPSIEPAFCGRRLGPRYNPERKTFRLTDWTAVTMAILRHAVAEQIAGMEVWAESAHALTAPRKPDQDKLDATICALIGYIWMFKPHDNSVMLGDLQSGYMITPACDLASLRCQGRVTEAVAREPQAEPTP
jgi:predicted RNase H-like nuclease